MENSTSQTKTTDKAETQPNWAAIGVFAAVILTIIFGVALWNGVFAEAWSHYHDPKNTDPVPRTEALRNLTWSMGTIGAVFAGFIGLVMAGFRTVSLHRQAKVAKTVSEFSEKKHASEAFATAIGQLGHEDFAVKLGAVYALEALAKTADDLHGPIFETLCAYVREKAPAPKDDDLTEKIETHGEQKIFEVIDEHLEGIPKPGVVVQAILTVIGRRDPERDPEGFRLDLQETDLRKADMRQGHFEGAILTGAFLCGAQMQKAHLRGADLNRAHLERAKLGSADLKSARIKYAYLESSYLAKANFKHASLMRSHLNDANLRGASLGNANLWGSYFSGANFPNITFDSDTNVQYADFREVNYIPAKLGSDFRATVKGVNTAQWPDDDDAKAWDRGDDDEIPF